MFSSFLSGVFRGLVLTGLVVGASAAYNALARAAEKQPNNTTTIVSPQERDNRDDNEEDLPDESTQEQEPEQQGPEQQEPEADNAATPVERPLQSDEIQEKWANRPDPMGSYAVWREWEEHQRDPDRHARWVRWGVAAARRRMAEEDAAKAHEERHDTPEVHTITNEERNAAPEMRGNTREERVPPCPNTSNIPYDVKDLCINNAEQSRKHPFSIGGTTATVNTTEDDTQEFDTQELIHKESALISQPNSSNKKVQGRGARIKQDEHVNIKRITEGSSADNDEHAAPSTSNEVEGSDKGHRPIEQHNSVQPGDSKDEHSHKLSLLVEDSELEPQIEAHIDGAGASAQMHKQLEPPAQILQHEDVKKFGTGALVPFLTPSDDTDGLISTCGAWALSAALVDALWPSEPSSLKKKERQLAIYKFIRPIFESDQLKNWAADHHGVSSFSDLDPSIQEDYLSRDRLQPGTGKFYSATQLSVVLDLLHTSFGNLGFPDFQIGIAQLNSNLDTRATSLPDETHYTLYAPGGYDETKPILWLRNISGIHWEPCVRNVLQEEHGDVSMDGHPLSVFLLNTDDPRASSNQGTVNIVKPWPWDERDFSDTASWLTLNAVAGFPTSEDLKYKQITHYPDVDTAIRKTPSWCNVIKHRREEDDEEEGALPELAADEPFATQNSNKQSPEENREVMEVDPTAARKASRRMYMLSPMSMRKKLLRQKYHRELHALYPPKPPREFSIIAPFDIEPETEPDTKQELNEVVHIPMTAGNGESARALKWENAVQLNLEGTVRKRRGLGRCLVQYFTQVISDSESGRVTTCTPIVTRVGLLP